MELMEENMFLFRCYQELLQTYWIYLILPVPPMHDSGANGIPEQNEPLNLTTNGEDNPTNRYEDNDDEKQLPPCASSSNEHINLSGRFVENQLKSYESSSMLYNEFLQLVFHAPPVLPSIPSAPSPAEIANRITEAFLECKRFKERTGAGGKAKRSCRSYKCNQCGEDFPTMISLTEHTESIHGRFRCHICQVGFVRKYNLLRHAAKHLHIMPYMCRLCSKEFLRKDCLCSHISSDHFKANTKKHVIERMPLLETFRFIDKQENAASSGAPLDELEEKENQLEAASCADNVFLKRELE